LKRELKKTKRGGKIEKRRLTVVSHRERKVLLGFQQRIEGMR